MIANPAQIAVPLPASAQLEGAQAPPLTSETHRPSSADAMFRKKEQKEVELDRKIEALRKKNEALMKRYQEVEEDKKRAEQEGMALQGRKGKAEDLTITINKYANEGRVVMKKQANDSQPAPRVAPGPSEGVSNPFCAGRGKRRQLLVTTGGNTKGWRIVSQQSGSREPGKDAKNAETVRSGRSSLSLKGDMGTQEDAGEREPDRSVEGGASHGDCTPHYQDVEGSGQQAHMDLIVPTSKEEQLEYLRWKKEREQIDRERVARHKNAKGQWRRAWDMDKTESGFCERVHADADHGNQARGGRNGRRGNVRPYAESQGHLYRTRDKGGKNLKAVSSKAKGKDRLTGRARRWDAKDEEKTTQTLETSIEEFLEELDAYGAAEVEDSRPGSKSGEGTWNAVSAVGMIAGGGPKAIKEATGDDLKKGMVLTPGKEERSCKPASPEVSPQRAVEKRVRFSTEAMEGSGQSNEEAPVSAPALDGALQCGMADGPGCQGDQTSAEKGVCHSKTPRTGAPDTETSDMVAVHADLVLQPVDGDSFAAQLPERLKSSVIRSPGERPDGGLSMLTTDCDALHPAHKSSPDQAKENGKIV